MTSVFSVMNSVSPIWCFRSNRILSVKPKHTTRCHRFHNRKNSLPLILCFFWSSSTQWILSSTSITFLPLLCVVPQGPNPLDRFQKTLLGNWYQRGRERSHQSLSFRERSHPSLSLLKGERVSLPQGEKEISRGREYSSRKYFSRIPDAWCSRGEMPHVFLRGNTCSYVLIFISSVHLYLSALIFCSLSSPNIPCKIQGEQDT